MRESTMDNGDDCVIAVSWVVDAAVCRCRPNECVDDLQVVMFFYRVSMMIQ